MSGWLAVWAGGVIGAAARHGVATAVSRHGRVLAATVSVNVVGSLLLGVVLAHVSSELALKFWGTGVAGSFTTMSALAVGAAELDGDQRWWVVAATVVAGGAAFFVGQHWVPWPA